MSHLERIFFIVNLMHFLVLKFKVFLVKMLFLFFTITNIILQSIFQTRFPDIIDLKEI